MTGRLGLRLRVLSVALLALLCSTSACVTYADTRSDLTGLADYIKNRFPYYNGKLGRDWCYNVESDPVYEWWSFSPGKTEEYVSPRVRHAIRIQAIYDDRNADGTIDKKYASVFIGLSFTGDMPDLPFGPPADLLPIPGAKKALAEPSATDACMDLATFLKAYLIPYKLAGANPAGAGEDPGGYRYWTFAGRTHRVRSAARIPITLDPATTGPAYLIIGFGGASGP